MNLTLHDKARLYHELARFVKSGFGFQRAATLLDEAHSNAACRNFARALKEGVQGGQTIANSLSVPGLGVSRLELSLIEAAEAAGALEEAFGYLGDYFESLLKTRREIQVRLIYPLILIHLAAILPSVPLLVQGTPPLEAFQGTIVALGVVWGLLLLLALLGPGIAKSAASSVAVDRLLGFIPLLGSTRRTLALQRFCQVFRMHLLCGRKISSALDSAGEASQSGCLQHAARILANTARSGQPAGSVIRTLPEFPREFAPAFSNAELSGTLTDELARWSAYYGQAAQEKLEAIGTWLPRFIYLLAAIYVVTRIFGMAGAIYQPLLDQLQGDP